MRVPRFRLRPSKKEEEVLLSAFQNGHHARGPHLCKFEAAVAERTGLAYAIGCGSGQMAIWLALEALDIRGERVVMPVIGTCGAVLHAIQAAGGIHVLADVDHFGRLTAESVRMAAGGAPIAAVVAPGLFGLPAEGAILENALGVPVVEDAAQGALTTFNQPMHPRCVTFSFYPTKGLPAIDGGMVATDDSILASHIREQLDTHAPQPGDRNTTRLASRLPDINACVAMAAIEEAPVRQARLKGISEAYARALSGSGISWLGAGLQTAALSRFILRFPDRTARDYFLSEAERRGIAASTELVEIGSGCKSLQSSQVASELLETTASLPFYPDLSDEEVADVCDVLASAAT